MVAAKTKSTATIPIAITVAWGPYPAATFWFSKIAAVAPQDKIVISKATSGAKSQVGTPRLEAAEKIMSAKANNAGKPIWANTTQITELLQAMGR